MLYLNFILSVFLIFSFSFTFAQKATTTTIASGNWTNTSIWDNGVPSSSTNAVIDSTYTVIINSTGNECKKLTINNGGELDLSSGNLSTGGKFLIDGGTFDMTGGTLSVGTSSTSINFQNKGGSFSFSGGTINVGGRFVHNSSAETSISGNGTINVLTAGDYDSNGYPVFSIFTGTFSVASSSTAEIRIKHINKYASKKYLFRYNPHTSHFDGGSLIIENQSNDTSKHFIGRIRDDIYKIESDIQGTNRIYFESLYNDNVTITNLVLTSGKAVVDTSAFFNFTNATIGANHNLRILFTGAAIFENAPTTNGTTEAEIRQKRDITKNAWHYISAPVNDTRSFSTIFNSILDSDGDYLYQFDEDIDTGTWREIYPDIHGFYSNSFTAARGYAIYVNDTSTQSDTLIKFDGKVRTSDVTINLTKTDGPNNGWNLIGNPYTAPLKANKTSGFLNENSSVLDATDGGVYLWDQSASDYTEITNATSASYLAPTQAFMVRTAADGNTATFKTSMLTNKWDTVYKYEIDTNWIYTSFKITNNEGLLNKTQISFNSDMTNGLDPFYDAGKLKANDKIALYTLLVDGSKADIDFGVQALPTYIEKMVSVNLGFDIKNSGDYTLTLNGFECTFDSLMYDKTKIDLKDTYLNKTVNLKDENYTFHSDAGSFKDRFILHFNKGVSGDEELKPKSITNTFLVFSGKDNSIIIKNTSNKEESDLKLKLFDIQGKLISNFTINKLSPGGLHILGNLNLNKGLYIIKIACGSSANSYKVLLH